MAKRAHSLNSTFHTSFALAAPHTANAQQQRVIHASINRPVVYNDLGQFQKKCFRAPVEGLDGGRLSLAVTGLTGNPNAAGLFLFPGDDEEARVANLSPGKDPAKFGGFQLAEEGLIPPAAVAYAACVTTFSVQGCDFAVVIAVQRGGAGGASPAAGAGADAAPPLLAPGLLGGVPVVDRVTRENPVKHFRFTTLLNPEGQHVDNTKPSISIASFPLFSAENTSGILVLDSACREEIDRSQALVGPDFVDISAPADAAERQMTVCIRVTLNEDNGAGRRPAESLFSLSAHSPRNLQTRIAAQVSQIGIKSAS